MDLFWHLVGSLRNSLNKIFLILILPAKFASGLSAAKDTGPPFREAARFYLSALSVSTAILIYVLYFLGGKRFVQPGTSLTCWTGSMPDTIHLSFPQRRAAAHAAEQSEGNERCDR
jgi:hypothetical protein